MTPLRFRAWNVRSHPPTMLYFGKDFNEINAGWNSRGVHAIGVSPGNEKFQLLVGDDIMQMPSALGDCILMQSTGLSDRNGTEIFEGDVLGLDDGEDDSTCSVIFDDGAFRRRFIAMSEIFNAELNRKIAASWVVIGNVWKNPELIQEAKG